MTIHWDPWHTVTVTAVTVPVTSDEFEDDVELRFDVTHPEPHENGCPRNCMTQQEIDQQSADGLPTEPGTYRIRAWGEYWPATMAGDPADSDGGVEVEAIDSDVTTLRRAAAQARAEGQEHDGPSRTAIFNFASTLMNEADKVESGDRGTLPPVLASARVWLGQPANAEDDSTPFAVRFGLMAEAQYEAFTTPGCHKCGTPFEFEGPKAQQPGTVHCRECAGVPQ